MLDRNYNQQQYDRNAEAFWIVVKRYIKILSRDVLGSYSGSSGRRRPDSGIGCIDVGRAIKKALWDDSELLQTFDRWFIAPEIEAGAHKPQLKAAGIKLSFRVPQSGMTVAHIVDYLVRL